MTPGTEEVKVARDGRVMTITLDRPGDQNRLTRDVLLALQGIVERLREDDETQAVVITGGGAEFFSMGILNPVVRASYTKDQVLDMVRTANRLYDALEALPLEHRQPAVVQKRGRYVATDDVFRIALHRATAQPSDFFERACELLDFPANSQ